MRGVLLLPLESFGSGVIISSELDLFSVLGFLMSPLYIFDDLVEVFSSEVGCFIAGEVLVPPFAPSWVVNLLGEAFLPAVEDETDPPLVLA